MAHLYKPEMGGCDRREQILKRNLDELDEFTFALPAWEQRALRDARLDEYLYQTTALMSRMGRA